MRLRSHFEIRIVLIVAVLFVSGSVSVAQNRSFYSPLDSQQCHTIKTETTGAGDYEGLCPGFDGYSLTLLEGDLRQNIIVGAPDGTKHSLDLWDVISGGFSHVGARAEWRIARQNGQQTPIALIIRYNVSEDADHPDKKTSYLAVAKITPSEICVTDKIPPAPDANQTARIAADNAATKPCLKKP